MPTRRLDIEIRGDERDAVRAADRTSAAYRGMGDDVERSGGRSQGALGGMAASLSTVGLAAGAAAAGIGVAAAAGWSLASSASDAAEAASAASQVFGSAYGQIEAAAANSARTVGLSRAAYLDASKSVGTLGAAAGLSGDDLAKFSLDIVGAAGDLASFNNTSVDEALTALQSGLRGEAEPLRRFGILLDDATLRQAALSQGLITTTNEALTPQQKTMAAQAVILGQLGAASGDFARTQGGMANQQRILSAQWEDAKAKLGEGLMPVATAARELEALLRDEFGGGFLGNGINQLVLHGGEKLLSCLVGLVVIAAEGEEVAHLLVKALL